MYLTLLEPQSKCWCETTGPKIFCLVFLKFRKGLKYKCQNTKPPLDEFSATPGPDEGFPRSKDNHRTAEDYFHQDTKFKTVGSRVKTRMIQAPTFSLSPAHHGTLDYSQIFYHNKANPPSIAQYYISLLSVI